MSDDLKDRTSRHGADTALEGMVIVGFLVLVGMLMFKVIPPDNKEQFGAAQGALIVLVTLIGKSLWERRGNEAVTAQTTAANAEIARDAVAKLPPVGTADTIAPPVADQSPATGGGEELPEYAR